MNRRDAIYWLLVLGFAPFASFAQQARKVWRIGVLEEGEQSGTSFPGQMDAFKAGLRALGYIEGRDYAVEARYAQGNDARLAPLVAELLVLKVDLILVTGTPSAMAARKATREVPILSTTAADPVGSGLAATLSRPGGNVTGLTNRSFDLVSKRLELLRELVPGMRRVGYLYYPDNTANVAAIKLIESDCGKLGCTVLPAPVRKQQDVAAAFNSLRQGKAQGVIVASPRQFSNWLDSIISEATKHRLPTMYLTGGWVKAGGLISYGPNFLDLYRRAAGYADKIFKGAKPGDLAIEEPSVFELVINLKTAKALGITIPPSVLFRADRAIE